jgi:hypothetical protein
MLYKIIAFVIILATCKLSYSHSHDNGVGGLASANGEIKGIYVTDDRGIAYVRQKGDKVFWFAEHPGLGYSHVFQGTREGDTIRGRFISVPKYGAKKNGRAHFRVQPGGSLKRIDNRHAIPYNTLKPRSLASVKEQLPLQAWPAFRARSGSDFDGGFEDKRNRRYYVRTLDNAVVFFVESKFKKGKRPKAAFVFWGKWVNDSRVFASGDLIALPKGQRKASGSFSLGFVDDGRLSGQSTFQHLQSVLATPMVRDQSLSLMGVPSQQEYVVSLQNGYATVEGDILVGREAPGNVQMALAVQDKGRFWPDCAVPFDIDMQSLVALSGDPDPVTATTNRNTVVNNINDAINAFNAANTITWRPKRAGDRDWVDFVARPQLCQDEQGNETVCGFSSLGRVGQGQQIIYSLPTSSVLPLNTGVFIHEMGHAVGLSHEHNRADRDDFVRINRAGIIPGFEGNFDKRGGHTLEIGPYDYGSITHYRRDEFARDGMETVIPLDDSATIGQRAGLSTGDVAVLQHFCPSVSQQTGVGRRGDGAGLALSDLDSDGRMDALVMAYDDAEGQNSFRIKMCEFSEDGTSLTCSGTRTVPGVGHRGEGAGIALGNLGGNRTIPDLMVAAYDTNNSIKYRVCFDVNSKLLNLNCSQTRSAGISTGRNADGLGLAIADLDGNPGDEIVIGIYDDPDGQNRIKYVVGSSDDGLANVRWDGPFQEPGTGHRGDGLGVAVFTQGGSGRPEIMFNMLDDRDGEDLFKTLTLLDVNTRGVSSGNSLIQRFHGHSNSSDGAGIAVADVDNDNSLDVVIMSYDDPANDDERDNQFKLRLIRSGADF